MMPIILEAIEMLVIQILGGDTLIKSIDNRKVSRLSKISGPGRMEY